MGSRPSKEKLQAALRDAFAAYRATGSLANLEACIDGYQRLIPVLDEAQVEHGNAVLDLAQLLGQRWAKTRSDTHWAEAETLIDGFRASIPRSDWREPLYALAQGVLLYARADATEKSRDIADALDQLQEARAGVRPGSFVDRFSSAYQGNLRLRRFESEQDPVDLETALADAAAVLTSQHALQPHIIHSAKTFARAASLHAELTQTSRYLDFAVEQLRRALSLSTGEVEAGDLQSVLGSLLRQRFTRGGDATDIDDAIEAYRAAAHQQGLPNAVRAARVDNLGNGLAARYKVRGDDADLDAMIACGREALLLFPAGSPALARTHANYAASLIAGWRKRRGEALLSEALETVKVGLCIEGAPVSAIAMLNEVLLEACLGSDIAETGTYLDQAIEAGEAALRAYELSEEDDPVVYRLAARARSGPVLRRLLAALIRRAERNNASRDRDLRRAVALGESAKAPLLTWELLRRALPAPAGADEGQMFFEKKVLAELAAYDVHEMAPADNLSEARRLRRMKQRRNTWVALERVWGEIAATGPSGEQYVRMRRDLPAALDEALQNQPPDWQLLSMLETEELSSTGHWQQGFCVIMLSPGGLHPQVLCAGPRELVRSAQKLFVEQVLDVGDADPSDETWWHELGMLLRCKLSDGRPQIMFSATSHSLNLPWQLLFERSGWQGPDGPTPPIVIVPSLVLSVATGASGEGWHVVRDAAEHFGFSDEKDFSENIIVELPMPTAPTKNALVVGDPSKDLAHASEEAVEVARALGVEPLLEENANITAVREGFRNARVVHIAAHASFKEDDPFSSVLHLADGDLSARDLLGSWSTSELVVLSACESGAGAPVMGGEVLGLATELLRSGVKGVIASIWPVDDAATAFLMQTFYSTRGYGLSNARALAKAISETQAQPGWSRPYYWAGFLLVQRGWSN
jgi:hypothetical protein